ncbi:MAG TPA: hypothetical protein VGB59_06160 [Allosphingosinicella sp.]|jgi:hypothetical protein
MLKTIAISSLSAACAILCATAGSAAGERARDTWEGLSARENIDRVFDLDSTATVKISGLAGHVSVETGSGSRAEVHIVSAAGTEAELSCFRPVVTASAASLAIAPSDNRDRRECRNIRARQEARLILPRTVRLHVSGVAGRVDVGAMEGSVRLEGIAGRAHIASARSAEISSIAGGVTLNVASTARDIRVSSTAGSVDLGFAQGANADVSVDSTLGRVTSLSPDIRLVRNNSGYRARVGSGGAPVRITSTLGPVRLRRP